MIESTSNRTMTVGIDLGDRFSHLCCLNADGEIVEEGRVRTTREAVRQRFQGNAPCRIALEVGTHSPWASRLLKDLGHEVIVANARKLRLIYENDRKNDRADAQHLARLARVDARLLSPIEHRSESSQCDLAVLRSRDALVRARTGLINHVRGCVKSVGARLPKCDARTFSKHVNESLPGQLKAALGPVLDQIGAISDQVRELEKLLRKLARESYPETALLRQVPGVGLLTSLSFVLTLEDPRRFKKSRSVGVYLGLTPRTRDSGERTTQMRISKSGDQDLRRLLVNCAHYILGPFGPPTDLRAWGLKIAERGDKNTKKKAVVAVARKLSILLHSLWRNGDVYEPAR